MRSLKTNLLALFIGMLVVGLIVGSGIGAQFFPQQITTTETVYPTTIPLETVHETSTITKTYVTTVKETETLTTTITKELYNTITSMSTVTTTVTTVSPTTLTKTLIATNTLTTTETFTKTKTLTNTVTTTVTATETFIPYLEKGRWNTIAVFKGSTDKTTELFYIPSDVWRINWSYTGEEYHSFGFYVYPKGEEFYIESLILFEDEAGSKSDTTYIYEGPGYYYIKALCTNIREWTIIVEAFVPEE